ncbi:MAG TPA: NAD(P)H-binding protein [Chitinophagales bacterium]|nr:NAD(P)H-binding protein [Chitinophagales bacterium]
MNYVLTGSIGHISKPLAKSLIAAGHQVKIITSKPDRKAEIEKLGANALVGSVEDQNFVTSAFAGADAVYLMVPPNFAAPNLSAFQHKVSDVYAAAVQQSGVKQVLVLSSIGAHMKKGAGPVDGVAYLEDKISALKDVNAVFLRPSYFYYNLLNQANIIKHAGIVTSTQPADYKLILTHPNDIAEAAAARLLALDFKGTQVQYIASDDTNSWQQITDTLTGAINKQGVPYVQSTDEQSEQAMLQAGVPATFAEAYKTMGQALRSGEMQADYWNNKPAQTGKVKLADFAREFAAVYNAG